MTIKVTYNSNDIYVSETISATYISVSYEVPSGGSGGVWGDITGTLSNQTDLQNALNAKYNNPTGTTAQYLRGDGTLATFPTITSGTVTSVGLTMPSAFSVANSPVTSSGTLAVTGAGTASQYIRGDGQLANFPDNQGGGSSVNYYLNGSVTQGTFGGTTYYEMSKTPILGAGTNFTRTNAQGNGYIASFITDAGDPSLLNIPAGNWNVEFYFQSSASGGSPQFYGELYKVDASNNFTLIGSGSTNPEGITNGTTIDQYFTSIPVPQTSLLVTDRLAIRIFVIPAGRTITLHTENSNLCEVLTTLSTGLNALNGLTAQVQYFATGTSGTDFAISSATDTHTFNLPTASATNRGALSSADWSSFNSKQNALTNPITGTAAAGQVAYFTGATTQAGSANLVWDNTNGRLGIGTATPSNLGAITIAGNIIVRPNGTAGVPVETSLRFFGASDAASGASITTVDQSSYSVGLGFFTRNVSTVSEKLRIFNNGNVLIQNGGTFTDSGQRLQVYGTTFLGNNTIIQGSNSENSASALIVQNVVGSQIIRTRNDGTIFIGNAASQAPYIQPHNGTGALNISGIHLYFGQTAINTSNSSPSGYIFDSSFSAQSTGESRMLNITGSFTGGLASGHTILRLSSVINQVAGSTGITRGLYIAPTLTNAPDFRAIEWSNNTGWGLYGAGTAPNLLNGSLTVANGLTLSSGSLSLPAAIHSVFGAAYRFWYRSSNRWTFEANNANIGFEFKHIMTSGNAFHIVNTSDTSQFLVSGAGNTILGSTTDSGEKLQVTGTAKITGASSFGGNMTLTNNQNGTTGYTISNTTNGTASFVEFGMVSNTTSGGFYLGKYSSAKTPYKAVSVTDAYLLNNIAGDIFIFNDFSSGGIKFAAGGSSTEQMRLTSAGNLCIGVTSGGDFLNIGAGTTAKAQINLASSIAPTSPNDGDIWFDGTNLRMRIGGITRTFTLV
jgi:hypothetical protein